MVGGAHISFYRQWAAAGMRKSIPMASTTFAVGNEHIVLSPEECDGMLVCYNYFQDLKNPVNEKFVGSFLKRFGADYPNITELAMGTYQGFWLWAEAVKKAGSIDRLKVVEALETGISIDAPSGKVTIDPPTHHCVLDVHIAEVADKKLKVLEDFAQQKPADHSRRPPEKRNHTVAPVSRAAPRPQQDLFSERPRAAGGPSFCSAHRPARPAACDGPCHPIRAAATVSRAESVPSES